MIIKVNEPISQFALEQIKYQKDYLLTANDHFINLEISNFDYRFSGYWAEGLGYNPIPMKLYNEAKDTELLSDG